ncbi:MAG: DNA repair protein RadA [Sulfuriflexus sp.]|nr:DNA repair protein RadA [Sulfuriflexus sp.]
MAKAKQVYSCTACGTQTGKWNGQCGDCGAWNTLEETVVSISSKSGSLSSRFQGYAGDISVQSLTDVSPEEHKRFSIGISELDRVLGGGVVPGSVILIGGDPGIGKSTILQQALAELGKTLKPLYITGEESLQQVSMRAHRLGLDDTDIRLLSETCVEKIIATAQNEKPQVMVVDSIQTVFTELLQSAPGSVAQVRDSAAQLVRYAKQTGTVLFLVGHVTKEGALAGPRVLEHMVDTVLYFEGDSSSPYRVIRAVKNRFGAVNELGVFAMTEKGLREVNNPSAIFLSRHEEDVPGSVVMVTREGSRPMLVEVQALVAESHMSNPRRVALGVDAQRLSMLLALLDRHGGVAMYDYDVFVNIVGGMRISETGADLSVILSILSSFRDKPVPKDWIVFGEVGLAGEIRPVQNGQERLREAVKHGFTRAIIPKANAPKHAIEGIEVQAVSRLSEVLDFI